MWFEKYQIKIIGNYEIWAFSGEIDLAFSIKMSNIICFEKMYRALSLIYMLQYISQLCL